MESHGYVSLNMTPDPSPSRRYSDDEVQRLLKRAADLETEAPSLLAKVDGPTLGELEAIASEAGINPALIRHAARELDSPHAPQSSAFLGAPAVFRLEETVRGEVDPSVLERLVPLIQRAADGVGQPSRSSFLWGRWVALGLWPGGSIGNLCTAGYRFSPSS